MLKLAIYFFLFFGFIFLVLFPPLGLLLLLLGFLFIVIAVANRKAEVLEDWSILIKNARGQRDKIISVTKDLIKNSKAPSIEMKEEKVGPGLEIVSFGETRDFLIVSDRRNTKLSSCLLYTSPSPRD